MSGGSPQRPILPAKNKKVAGASSSKENNRGPGRLLGGRPKGFTVMVGKEKGRGK